VPSAKGMNGQLCVRERHSHYYSSADNGKERCDRKSLGINQSQVHVHQVNVRSTGDETAKTEVIPCGRDHCRRASGNGSDDGACRESLFLRELFWEDRPGVGCTSARGTQPRLTKSTRCAFFEAEEEEESAPASGSTMRGVTT